MPRPAAVSPATIRATVLAMLAEAGVDVAHHVDHAVDPAVAPAAPATGARFRQAVSVRRLRARLGAGDPAMLSRHLNAIEAELVQAGLSGIALPALPAAIAEQMQALWQAAVAVQLDDVVKLRQDAARQIEAADTARQEAELRTEMLRTELTELRTQASAREAALADLRADSRVLADRAAVLQATTADLQTQLAAAQAALEASTRTHAGELATAQARYEGLSKQLLQETAHQRDAWRAERERLTGLLAQAEERTRALEGRRDQLLTEVAEARDAHQRAAAEAAALATVVSEQRQTLQALRPALGRSDPKRTGLRQKPATAGKPATRPAGPATGAAASPRAVRRPR
jgi:DNA repair exonuclease SbcCD ATPase subunit